MSERVTVSEKLLETVTRRWRMEFDHHRLKLLALSIPLSFNSSLALSLGLGNAEVRSILGQPLLAEIPIVQNEERYDSDEIRVRQILGEKALDLGYELAADAPPYRLRLLDKQGVIILQVRSRYPMNEPFVSVLVSLEWPAGRLYRDYNLLLDIAPEPVFEPQSTLKSQPVSPATTSAPRGVRRLSQTETANTSRPEAAGSTRLRGLIAGARAEQTSNSSPQVNRNNAGDQGRWRVGNGDTLSQIAQKIRPDEQIKLTEVVEALFQLNPHAFEGGDINRLRGGALLSLPTPQQYSGMDRWDDQTDRSAQRSATAPVPVSKPSESAVLSQPAVRPVSKPQPETVATIPRGEVYSSGNGVVRYRVNPGDTLSHIAQTLRRYPEEPLGDIMQAVYDHNPQAFARGDIDQLKLGAELRLPGWVPAGPTAADHGSDALPKADEGEPRAIVTHDEELPDTKKPNGDGLVRLSRGTEMAANSTTAILRQIDTVAELVDKVNRENQAIRARIEKIEKSEQLILLERLLELQNRQIENLKDAMMANHGKNLLAADQPLDPAVNATNSDDGEEPSAVFEDQPSAVFEDQPSAVFEDQPSAVVEDSADNRTIGNAVNGAKDDVVSDTAAQMQNSEAKAVSSDVSSAPTDTPKSKTDTKSQGFVSSWWWLALAACLAGLAGWLRREQLLSRWDNWRQQTGSVANKDGEDQSELTRVWDPDEGRWRLSSVIPDTAASGDLSEKSQVQSSEPAPESVSSGRGDKGFLDRHPIDNDGLQAPSEADDVNSLESGLDFNFPSSSPPDESPVVESPQPEDESPQPEDESPQPEDESLQRQNKNPRDDEYLQSIDESHQQENYLQPETADQPQPQAGTEDDSFYPQFEEIDEDIEELNLSDLKPPAVDLFPEESSGEDKSSQSHPFDRFGDEFTGEEFEFSLPDDFLTELDEPAEQLQELPSRQSTDSEVLSTPIIDADDDDSGQAGQELQANGIDQELDSWLGGDLSNPADSAFEDVINEAMIYAAYGRHEFAVSMLEEQLQAHPDDPSLQQALREIHDSQHQFKSDGPFSSGIVDDASSEPNEASQSGNELDFPDPDR